MKFDVVTGGMFRIDDRLSTLGNTTHVEVALSNPKPSPGILTNYGRVHVGITGVIVVPVPLIIATHTLTDFGIYVHRDMMFPRGVPDDMLELLWDVWYSPIRTGISIEVLGVQL